MKIPLQIVIMQSILFCFCILLFSCSNDPKIVETFVSSENLPSETIKEAELTYTEKGKVKVKIIRIEVERRRLGLSLKQAEEEEEEL